MKMFISLTFNHFLKILIIYWIIHCICVQNKVENGWFLQWFLYLFLLHYLHFILQNHCQATKIQYKINQTSNKSIMMCILTLCFQSYSFFLSMQPLSQISRFMTLLINLVIFLQYTYISLLLLWIKYLLCYLNER